LNVTVTLPTFSKRSDFAVRIEHLVRHEVINLGAMILVVPKLRANPSNPESCEDFIHDGAVDDEADHIVNANPSAFHTRLRPRASGDRTM
jgi:hypothetical protein